MPTDGSGIVAHGGWVRVSAHGRPRTRVLFWSSAVLLLPALAAAATLWMSAETTAEAAWDLSCQVGCWSMVGLDGAAWLVTLVAFFAERPRVFERLVENPDYDPKNLY